MLIFAFHAIHVIAIETWHELSGMAGKKETTYKIHWNGNAVCPEIKTISDNHLK